MKRCVCGLALALTALLSCKTTDPVTAGVGEAAAPVYVAPPPYVFERLDQLGPANFAAVRWGVDRLEDVRGDLQLQRYDLQEARWGLPGQEFVVLQAQTARRSSTTAFVFDADEGTLRTVLVRDLPSTPPPQANVFGFLPFLGAFPGKIQVYAYREEDGTHALPYRFLFFPDQGIKMGLGELTGGTWSLDHVEYFDPDWGAEELDAFKYGGRLELVGTITAAERR